MLFLRAAHAFVRDSVFLLPKPEKLSTPTCRRLWQEAASGASPAQLPLKFSDLEAPAAFFAKGFGNNGCMLLASKDGLLKDHELLQKLLLLGRSEIKLSKVVDVYQVVKQVGDKRRIARPSQANVPCLPYCDFVLAGCAGCSLMFYVVADMGLCAGHVCDETCMMLPLRRLRPCKS